MTVLDAYDRLAPHYRAFSAQRSSYLGAIDRYVVEHAPCRARLLDVGSGDGGRAAATARRIDAERLVLCEPSAQMAALCRTRGADAVWQVAAEALPQSEGRFEVITCLWNVLGHLPCGSARVGALGRMCALLAPEGRIFCDVNNRHNARAYGRTRVFLRRVLDGAVPDERRGDARFEWDVGDERIPATGHLFTPREMRELIAEAGLEIDDLMTVDYLDGAISRSPFDGQLLYRLRANRLPRSAGG